MLTTLNPLTMENVFNGRFPKIFIDRVAYEESINQLNQQNSSLNLTINTHMFDFKNSDDMFNLLDDQELSSELVVNFLFTSALGYDELTPDDLYKLSDSWLNTKLTIAAPFNSILTTLAPRSYHKFSYSLLELLAFDSNEKEKLSKSILFENADVDVFLVPLKSLDFNIPVAYKDGEISQQRLKLFVYFSLDENDIAIDKLSANKGLLSTFFGGINEVQLITNSRLNQMRMTLYNPETEKYWQREAIYTSTDIPKAVPDFTPGEVASKYLSLVRSISNDMNTFIRRSEADFIADITTPYYTTKKDSFFVRNIAVKIENLLVDSVGNQFRTGVVRRLVNFISGVDAQLEAYPTLELRRIGDGRIQRKTISFLDQADIGRITPSFNRIKDYLLPRFKSFCVSNLFYASDDDGSVEVYLVLNKTNMMRVFSPFYNYFPNLETLLPEAKSLFTIKEVTVSRDHAYVSSQLNVRSLPQNRELPIGRYIFTTAALSQRLNDYKSFEGYFTGRRERTVLQVQDTETTTLSGVEGESETSTTTTDTDIIEEVYETVDAITTGVAARLYTPNQFEDELILLSLNDQSVNASEEISTSGLIVTTDDPLDEGDKNLNLYLHYRFSAKFSDKTGVFLNEQLKYLSKAIVELEAYLEDATEKCAFNDITSVFNDYFIDRQYRLYSDLALAPWNKLPSIFSQQMALFSRIENIDASTIQQNAIEIKKLLDPKTATLDSIQTVLNSVNVFKSSLKSKLIDIGAISRVPQYNGILDIPGEVNDEVELVGDPAIANWFRPRLSQYTGVQRLETIEETVDNRVKPLPEPDDAVGIFVQAFAPRFRTWWNGISTSKDNGANPFKKLQTVAKYIVNNNRNFGLSDPLPDKGSLKLQFIRPWRNRGGRSAWRSRSVDVILKSDSSQQYEQGGRLTISMSNFSRDSYTLVADNATANQAMQRLCQLMMTAETLIGDFGGSSDEIRMVRPNQNSDSSVYFHDNGYAGNSDQHLLFYKANTKVATKGSHSDHLSGGAKDILNSKVFKNSKSGVADRDGLYYNSKNDAQNAVTPIQTTFDELRKVYLETMNNVFDSFFIDGVDLIPEIQDMINTTNENNKKEKIRQTFKKVYTSGFYPWPGYPNIPDSLNSSKNDLFG